MSSTAIPSPSRPVPGTMRLGFEDPSITGRCLAEIVEVVRAQTNGRVVLDAIESDPARLTFFGPLDDLERLRAAVLGDALRPAIGSRVMSLQIDPVLATNRSRARRRLVLWLDGDASRARRSAEILRRAEVETCVVERIETARILMLYTDISFDAIVVHHELPEAEGLDLLASVPVEAHGASVVVFDEVPSGTRAQTYRSHGAYRYGSPPDSAMVLIGRVNAAILDTQAWRGASDPHPLHVGAPPRLLLDPQLAADRLRYLCRLSPVEREVAYWVLMGLRDVDIARMLRRSERTAKRHVGNILEKAGVQNRSSLWAVLYRDGREPGDPTSAESCDAANGAPLRPVDDDGELPN